MQAFCTRLYKTPTLTYVIVSLYTFRKRRKWHYNFIIKRTYFIQ